MFKLIPISSNIMCDIVTHIENEICFEVNRFSILEKIWVFKKLRTSNYFFKNNIKL